MTSYIAEIRFLDAETKHPIAPTPGELYVYEGSGFFTDQDVQYDITTVTRICKMTKDSIEDRTVVYCKRVDKPQQSQGGPQC